MARLGVVTLPPHVAEFDENLAIVSTAVASVAFGPNIGRWPDVIENRIKHRHLTAFVEVARQKSIGKAAVVLAVSQPAVSKTIRELEEILGVELFDRSHRSVVLSPFGDVFLRFAGSAIEALRQGVESLEIAARSGLPAIRLGAAPLAVRNLTSAIVRIGRVGQGMTVSVVTAVDPVLMTMLAAGDIDMVLAGLPQTLPTGVVAERLYDEHLGIVVRAGHPLVSEAADKLGRRLGDYQLLVAPPDSAANAASERLLARLGTGAGMGRVESVATQLCRRVTLGSDCVWVAAEGEVADDLDEGRMRRLPIDTGGADVPVGLMRRSGLEPTVAAGLLIAAIHESVAESLA